MGMRRVAITGVGVVSALGVGRDAHFSGLREGRCGIGELEFRDVERLSVKIGGQAKDFKAEDYFGRSEIVLLDRFSQMAMVAGKEAMENSGLELTEELGLRSAVVIGSGLGGLGTLDENYRAVYEEGKNRVHPFVVPRTMPNSASSQLSMAYGIKGPAWTVSTACSSSNHAIGQAFHLVRSGISDVAVCGGAESMLCFGGVKAWEGLRVMSKDGCRPFCKTRNGMVQGEGAAVLVLEDMESAKARGAHIWGEIAGFGMSSDAGDIVQPDPNGASRAIQTALKDAGLAPEDIGYVNAHGTATTMNDRSECVALRDAFGAHADRLMVSSTKSMHGHGIGAAGALEALAVLMALNEGVIPPTIGYSEPDPDCDLDIVPNTARDSTVNAAISNSFAFGGLNAVLAFRSV